MRPGKKLHAARKTKVHLFLISKQRGRASAVSAPLARGGAVRLDLVPSRELLLVVQALVVVLLGLRAARRRRRGRRAKGEDAAAARGRR